MIHKTGSKQTKPNGAVCNQSVSKENTLQNRQTEIMRTRKPTKVNIQLEYEIQLVLYFVCTDKEARAYLLGACFRFHHCLLVFADSLNLQIWPNLIPTLMRFS